MLQRSVTLRRRLLWRRPNESTRAGTAGPGGEVGVVSIPLRVHPVAPPPQVGVRTRGSRGVRGLGARRHEQRLVVAGGQAALVRLHGRQEGLDQLGGGLPRGRARHAQEAFLVELVAAAVHGLGDAVRVEDEAIARVQARLAARVGEALEHAEDRAPLLQPLGLAVRAQQQGGVVAAVRVAHGPGCYVQRHPEHGDEHAGRHRGQQRAVEPGHERGRIHPRAGLGADVGQQADHEETGGHPLAGDVGHRQVHLIPLLRGVVEVAADLLRGLVPAGERIARRDGERGGEERALDLPRHLQVLLQRAEPLLLLLLARLLQELRALDADDAEQAAIRLGESAGRRLLTTARSPVICPCWKSGTARMEVSPFGGPSLPWSKRGSAATSFESSDADFALIQERIFRFSRIGNPGMPPSKTRCTVFSGSPAAPAMRHMAPCSAISRSTQAEMMAASSSGIEPAWPTRRATSFKNSSSSTASLSRALSVDESWGVPVIGSPREGGQVEAVMLRGAATGGQCTRPGHGLTARRHDVARAVRNRRGTSAATGCL